MLEKYRFTKEMFLKKRSKSGDCGRFQNELEDYKYTQQEDNATLVDLIQSQGRTTYCSYRKASLTLTPGCNSQASQNCCRNPNLIYRLFDTSCNASCNAFNAFKSTKHVGNFFLIILFLVFFFFLLSQQLFLYHPTMLICNFVLMKT